MMRKLTYVISFVATRKMYVEAQSKLVTTVKPTPINLPASSSLTPCDVATLYAINGTMKRRILNTTTPPFVPGSKNTGKELWNM
jgi:hypothetical protein